MTTTFETAQCGDKVWSFAFGWGEIYSLGESETYPVRVLFPDKNCSTYTLGGKRLITHTHQTLFWDEVKIEAPHKPLPDLEVDTKVLVWVTPDKKQKRHFSHFRNGRVFAYDNGSTSFTRLHAASTTGWPHWELAE